MFIGVLQIELSIPGAHSLKEKRRVVKGLLERLRRQFGVSAAEVSAMDTWNRAGIGISCVSNDRRHAESCLQNVLNAVEREREAMVIDSQIEVF